MKQLIVSGLALIALTFCVVPARASTIVVATDLGPGGTYIDAAYDIKGASSPFVDPFAAESQAVSFVPSISTDLSDVILALGLAQGPASIVVGIASDNSGLPGPVLATLTQNGTVSNIGALVTFTCDACVALEASTRYWVVTGVSDKNTFVFWNYSDNSLGDIASNASGSVNGPWFNGGMVATPAFEVDGVPEPASLMSIATGVMGLAFRVYSERRARNR
jgi:hypothetical protein